MKKIVALVLALVLCLTAAASLADGIAKEDIKLGIITLHDEQSTYDKNFIDSAKQAAANLGLAEEQVIIVSGIPESDECRQKALDLVDEGCNIIFADSLLPAPRPIPKTWRTSTTRLPPSMKAATWPASLPD